MGKKNGLSPKRALFVSEYLKDQNGTQAAIRAGYSKKTAEDQAARLLGFVGVKEAIRAGMDKILKKKEITAERVVSEIARLAFSDIGSLFNDNGDLEPIKELPRKVRATISSVEVEDIFEGSGQAKKPIGQVKKVKLWCKVRSLELLCKRLGLLVERHEVTGNGFIMNQAIPEKANG